MQALIFAALAAVGQGGQVDHATRNALAVEAITHGVAQRKAALTAMEKRVQEAIAAKPADRDAAKQKAAEVALLKKELAAVRSGAKPPILAFSVWAHEGDVGKVGRVRGAEKVEIVKILDSKSALAICGAKQVVLDHLRTSEVEVGQRLDLSGQFFRVEQDAPTAGFGAVPVLTMLEVQQSDVDNQWKSLVAEGMVAKGQFTPKWAAKGK